MFRPVTITEWLVWLSGNDFGHTNYVKLRQGRLLLELVTTFVHHPGIHSGHSGPLSLAVHPRVVATSRFLFLCPFAPYQYASVGVSTNVAAFMWPIKSIPSTETVFVKESFYLIECIGSLW